MTRKFCSLFLFALATLGMTGAWAASPYGNHDGIRWLSANATYGTWGWACDMDTPSAQLQIHFYIDGQFAGAVNAGIWRQDVVNAGLCAGTGNHGFDFYVPTQFLTAGHHDIDAYAIDTNGTGPNPFLGRQSYDVTPPPYSSVSITLNTPSPTQAEAFNVNDSAYIQISASDTSGYNPQVVVYANGNEIARLYSPPYTYSYHPGTPGVYAITATATNPWGQQANSGTASVAFHNLVSVLEPGNVTSPTWIYIPPGTPPNENDYPKNQWYQAVRLFPTNPVQSPLSSDFSKYFSGAGGCAFPLGNGWCKLTDLQTPTPYYWYQRGNTDTADVNSTSAFQQFGASAGSYINTFASGCMTGGGGPHSVYEYRPNPPLAVFDGDPKTEIVLQADIEVPAVYYSNPADAVEAQVGVAAYFTSTDGTKQFAVLAGAYDSKGLTAEFRGNDGFTGFTSSPFGNNGLYLTQYAVNGDHKPQPYFIGASFTGQPWDQMRTFRGYFSRTRFANTLTQFGMYGYQPEDFRLTSYAVLHEIPNCGLQDGHDNGQMSSAMRVSNPRVMSARYH